MRHGPEMMNHESRRSHFLVLASRFVFRFDEARTVNMNREPNLNTNREERT